MLSCETVNICNNDCVFCAYSKMERKKEVMSLQLFEKVLKDYSELGGGTLSLTPLVGDVFTDELLFERMKLLKNYSKITEVSFTTNATLSDRLNDNNLEYILDGISRVNLSVYGLEPEEHRGMTRRDDYNRAVRSMQRIIRLTGDSKKIRFGFRLFRRYNAKALKTWMLDNFGIEAPYNRTNSYDNWADSIDTSVELPFDGEWTPITGNTEACFMPLLGRVLSSGKVTFCHCDDSDNAENLSMGNIKEKSLAEIYTNEKINNLWELKGDGKLPPVCRRCTFHRPFSNLPSNDFIFKNPLDFIGG